MSKYKKKRESAKLDLTPLIDVVFLLADKFNPYSFVIMNVILSFVVLIFCSLIVFNQNKKKKMDIDIYELFPA